MIKLMVSLILWSGACLGLGLMVQFRFWSERQKNNPLSGLGALLLFGFWGVALGTQVVHFFLPVSNAVSTVIVVVGWGGLIHYRKVVSDYISFRDILLGFVLILGFGLLATVCFFNIDTGYYHLPTVALLKGHPILPGIANVFGPYGHNSVWFLVEAAFGLPYLGLASQFSANALMAVAFVFVLRDLYRLSSISLGAFIIWVLLGFNHFGLGLGGVTPDFPSLTLSCLVWASFLGLVFKDFDSEPWWVLMLFSVALAISTKVSNLVLWVPLGFVLFYNKTTLQSAVIKKALKWNIGFGSVWLVRGVLTSGCLLYPQSTTCGFGLPWAMPKEVVARWYADVKKHLCGTAISENVFSNPDCLREWWQRLLHEPVWKSVGVGLGVVLGVALFQKIRSRYHSRASCGKNIQMSKPAMAVLLGVTLIWLFSAPNLRFALWLVFAWCGLLTSALLQWGEIKWTAKPFYFYAGLVIALGLTLRSALLTRPFPVRWIDWPTVPMRSATPVMIFEGLKISTPNHDFRCWEVDPPCTPEINSIKIHSNQGVRFWFSAEGDKSR